MHTPPKRHRHLGRFDKNAISLIHRYSVLNVPIILYISAVWFYSSLQIKCLSVQKRAIDRFVVRLITQFHSIQFHSIPFHYNSRQQSIQIIDSFRSHFFYSHFYILAFNDFSVFVFNGRQNMNCLLGTKAASSVRWYSIPPPHKNEYHT